MGQAVLQTIITFTIFLDLRANCVQKQHWENEAQHLNPVCQAQTEATKSMFFFVLNHKASKDQTRCLSATMLQPVNQTQSRIDAPLSACPAQVAFFPTAAHAAMFLPSQVSSMGETGNHATWEHHGSENDSSNMLDEDKGSPGF